MTRHTCLGTFYLLSQIFNLFSHFLQKWGYTNCKCRQGRNLVTRSGWSMVLKITHFFNVLTVLNVHWKMEIFFF